MTVPKHPVERLRDLKVRTLVCGTYIGIGYYKAVQPLLDGPPKPPSLEAMIESDHFQRRSSLRAPHVVIARGSAVDAHRPAERVVR